MEHSDLKNDNKLQPFLHPILKYYLITGGGGE